MLLLVPFQQLGARANRLDTGARVDAEKSFSFFVQFSFNQKFHYHLIVYHLLRLISIGFVKPLRENSFDLIQKMRDNTIHANRNQWTIECL